MKTKEFKISILEKFLNIRRSYQSPEFKSCLPNGEFYDISGMQLMENKLFGVRETHRLVITIEKEKWRMGQVIKNYDKILWTKSKNYSSY
jgi:hypothetical protein